ncbi:MAG: DegT/DnrJ/EryC1/StrS family aminotransferase [Candidatus ainarchaeum sp.]|nr:DegT/DnrJ/EryC1/StrS family aminotransferase [Candidatus ainarchaeum sp.]
MLNKVLSKFYKIPYLVPYWDTNETGILKNCFFENSLVEGSHSEKLVKMLNNKTNLYSYPTNLGRSAIQLALGQIPKDGRKEVLISSFNCSGVVQPIVQAGYIPVFIDVGIDFNISIDGIRNNYTSNTIAVIVPGLFGKSPHWKEIKTFCKEKNIFVIDDAAQYLGLDGAGTNGDFGIFSFALGKPVESIYGGVLLSKKKYSFELKNKTYANVLSDSMAALFRGKYRKYTLPYFAIKDGLKRKLLKNSFSFDVFNIPNVSSGITIEQFKKLDKMVKLRQRNAKILLDGLSNIDELTLPEFSKDHAFLKFVVSLKKAKQSKAPNRSTDLIKFVNALASKGIETEWVYLPLHLREPYTNYRTTDLTVTNNIWKCSVSLPNRPGLSEENMIDIATHIKKSVIK